MDSRTGPSPTPRTEHGPPHPLNQPPPLQDYNPFDQDVVLREAAQSGPIARHPDTGVVLVLSHAHWATWSAADRAGTGS